MLPAPMSIHVLDAMQRGGHERVLAIVHAESGLRALLAIHDSFQNRSFGGVRRFAYARESAALVDALRLARAMSFKCALAGIPAGGAKLVIWDHAELEPRAAYRHIGERVEALGGTYFAGPDMGTGEREMGWIAECTRHATDPGPCGPGELSECTAAGVLAGIEAALAELDGRVEWSRQRIVVQGLGSVGEELARRLLARGARVSATEIDAARARDVAARLELELLAPGSEHELECDVFAPCGMGGGLHDLTLHRLRARIVAGAANNPLAREVHGERLHERGILYVPDVAITAGALLRGARFQLEGVRTPVEEVAKRVGATCRALLRESRETGRSPAAVATQRALALLAERRASAPPAAPEAAHLGSEPPRAKP